MPRVITCEPLKITFTHHIVHSIDPSPQPKKANKQKPHLLHHQEDSTSQPKKNTQTKKKKSKNTNNSTSSPSLPRGLHSSFVGGRCWAHLPRARRVGEGPRGGEVGEGCHAEATGSEAELQEGEGTRNLRSYLE